MKRDYNEKCLEALELVYTKYGIDMNNAPAQKMIDEILSRVHPNFSNLRESTLKLHRRNVLQILGQDLATPSHFVLCYTRDGAETFTSFETVGTGTVIRLANHYNIPVFNLRNKNWADRFKEFMKG